MYYGAASCANKIPEQYSRHNVCRSHRKYDLGKQMTGLIFQLHAQFQLLLKFHIQAQNCLRNSYPQIRI